MSERVPVALTIAGSDSGGGAGIEMDLKVFAALGVFGACAITALTAQNTTGVLGAWEVPAEFVTAQIAAVVGDLPVAAAKTGMLSSEGVVRAAAAMMKARGFPYLVADPVVVAKDGSHLLTPGGLAALKEDLLPVATLITPNLLEAEALTGLRVTSEEEARRAAENLRAAGSSWVLIKGGHGRGETVTDLLLGPDGAQAFTSPRLPGGPYHGTGCALSAAITAHLARGLSVPEAVAAARDFVHQLIRDSVVLGRGARLLHPRASCPSLDPRPETPDPIIPGASSCQSPPPSSSS